jgi:hypothetical protein
MRHWLAWFGMILFVLVVVFGIGGLFAALVLVTALGLMVVYGPDWRAL